MALPDRSDGQIEQAEIQQLLLNVPKQDLINAIADSLTTDDGAAASDDQPLESLSIVSHSHFSGPLPSPGVLAGYEDTHAGLADRVVSMAEREQSHRHGMEREALSEGVAFRRRGQHYALAICVFVIIATTALILSGHGMTGVIFGGGSLSLVALASVFITGRGSERSQK